MAGLAERILTGNAVEQVGCESLKGWFIGHFVKPNESLRHSEDVEVKCGVHSRQERRSTPVANKQATTLTFLISGTFHLAFPELEQSVILKQLGDYVIFGPEVVHDWEALEDSVVLTVRWPSIPDDQFSRPTEEV